MFGLVTRKKLYSLLYKEADKILKAQNPCHISKDGKTCAGGRPCCTDCEHLGPTGCKVEALFCKVWICAAVKYKPENQQAFISLQTLETTGIAMGVPFRFRSSKEQSFDPNHEVQWR